MIFLPHHITLSCMLELFQVFGTFVVEQWNYLRYLKDSRFEDAHWYITQCVSVKMTSFGVFNCKTSILDNILVITATNAEFCVAKDGGWHSLYSMSSRSRLAVTFFRQGFKLSSDTWTSPSVWGSFVCAPVGPVMHLGIVCEMRPESLHIYDPWQRNSASPL